MPEVPVGSQEGRSWGLLAARVEVSWPLHCPGQDGDTLLEFPWCGAALQLQAWQTSSPTGCLHDTGHVPKGNPMALQSHRLRTRCREG